MRSMLPILVIINLLDRLLKLRDYLGMFLSKLNLLLRFMSKFNRNLRNIKLSKISKKEEGICTIMWNIYTKSS